jgi:hypothetical protein
MSALMNFLGAELPGATRLDMAMAWRYRHEAWPSEQRFRTVKRGLR